MALYRKYRPASFSEVVGQQHVTDPLSVALSSGRINHAYLFSGPRGCGKTSSARILARSLNCEQGPTADPCGQCDSCVALAPGGPGTLDVTELDAASHGGVDDTRDLRERAFFAPASSRYRVLIIDEAHMVTNAGFNALLKIVEEPPEHLIFIFATTEPDKVLPTIRSRTHHYPFRLLTPTDMRGLAERVCEQESVAIEPTVFPLVIRAGGGSPRDTLSVLDQLMAGSGDEGITYHRAVALLGATEVALIDDSVDALAAGDGATLFRTVDKVVEAGHDPRRFATDLLQRLRDLIMVQSVPQAIERGLVDAPVEQAETMRRQAEQIGPATLARCADMVHEGMASMRGATSPRLLLEILCAKLLLPSADSSMEALLQRVESLESGAVQPGGGAAAGGGAVAAGPAAAAGAAAGAAGGAAAGAVGAAAAGAGAPEGRPKYVRRSQQQAAAVPDAAAPAPPAAAEPAGPAEPAVQPPAPAPAEPTPTEAAEPVPAESGTAAPAPVEEESGPTSGQAPTEAAAPVAPGPADAAPQPSTEAVPGHGAGEAPQPDRVPSAAEVPGGVTEFAHAPEPEPEPEPSGPGQPPEGAQPGSDSGAGGGIEAEDLRRAWPAVRAAVRNRTRTVEVMLAGATVAGVDGSVIHLLHDNLPLAKRLSQPHNATVITDSVAEVVGGQWSLRCTSGSAAAAGGAAPSATRTAAPTAPSAPTRPQAPAAPADTPGSAQGAGPPGADAPAPPQQPEPQGWERRVRDAGSGAGTQDRSGGAPGAGGHGGYDDIPPPPEEPEPEPGEPDEPQAPVTEDEMVDEARSGPQNLDHRTGEDIALALLKEHLGARPIDR